VLKGIAVAGALLAAVGGPGGAPRGGVRGQAPPADSSLFGHGR
jgi:hypothetical protein